MRQLSWAPQTLRRRLVSGLAAVIFGVVWWGIVVRTRRLTAERRAGS